MARQTITLTVKFDNRGVTMPSTGLWDAIDRWGAENCLGPLTIESTNVEDAPAPQS